MWCISQGVIVNPDHNEEALAHKRLSRHMKGGLVTHFNLYLC